MLRRRKVMLSGAAIFASAPAWAMASSPDAIASSLAQIQPDQQAYSVSGIVAGTMDGAGQRIVTQGVSGTGRALDGDTVFEIASITKVFTSLLLADMVLRKEVDLDDLAAKYLPAHVHVPDFEGRGITLRDLVTYAPGLPGWPDNLPKLDMTKPFPEYSIDQMYAALEAYKLATAPGTVYRYSNFGFGLLGHVLSRAAGMRFEDLLVSRICTPLCMESTRFTLTPSMQMRVAPGHNGQLQQVESWRTSSPFDGAGALYSTANDLLKFLAAASGREASSLAPAFATLLEPNRRVKTPNMHVAAGWFVLAGHGDELVWKNGDKVGYTSFMGYSKKSGQGLVLLANSECAYMLTPVGWHILNPDIPVKKLG
jgi:D-alanyl-D-alanine-carboxypeptidase/D-alanyl-D-alanine-endopeptidase